jgi:UDP-N-acetylglucosamine 2-epimerase (non-hydrolysing)
MTNSLSQVEKHYKKKIIFGIHPRTLKKFNDLKISLGDNIIITAPFGIIDYYKLLKNSYFVVSDSGTISEEANILGFRAVLLRYSTEHPETIDSGSIILGNVDWPNLETSINVMLNLSNTHNTIINYHDSNFSEKVCKIISGYHSVIDKFLWLK